MIEIAASDPDKVNNLQRKTGVRIRTIGKDLTDPVEKLLAQRLKVIYVKGKRERRVPVIITS